MNGSSVKAIRIKEDLTQAEFASKLRVSPSCIAAVENERRAVSDNLRIRIAQYFGTGEDITQAVSRARESANWAL